MRLRELVPASSLVAAILLASAPGSADEQEDLEREIEEMVRAQAEPVAAEELEGMAKKILREVATVRELEVKRPVQMEVATRQQIVSYVDSRIREEMNDNELSGQEAALKRLALIPERLDMRKFLLDLYGEQVAGYYDPFKQKFFIASWMGVALQAPIMAHELTHALQDQHFNLKPFLTPIPQNSDATSARQAVVEGDAVVSMFAFLGAGRPMTQGLSSMLRRSMTSPAYPIFAGAPLYFQEGLFFPYADGAEFVAAVKGTGGFRPVTALYKDLPRSSEQILHPEKYSGKRDDPTPVELPLKLEGWTEVHTDVLGELVIRVMMAGFYDADRAATIAEGWDGDRYRAFQRTGKLRTGSARGTLVVLRTVWDTPEDANEFFEGYAGAVSEKYGGATRRKDKTEKKDGKGTVASFTTVEDGRILVERRGAEVVVVDGAPDEETEAAARKAAWSG